MKRLSLLLALVGAAFLTGCESTEGVRTAFQRRIAPEYRTLDVKTDTRTAYDVVRLALADMGYTQTKGGPAQGFYEGMSEVIPADPTRAARQTTVKVKFGVSTRLPGDSEISALFYSVEDAANEEPRGMATEVPLGPKDTQLYEILFSRVEGRLAEVK